MKSLAKLTLTASLTAALLTFAAAQTAPAQTAPVAAPTVTPSAPAPATTPTTAAPVAAPHPPVANYITVGNMYYGQGKFDQAYVAFRTAVQFDPLNPAALLGLGRSQVKLRLYEPALGTLRSLTKADPRNISGYIALAQAYQQQYIGSSDRAGISKNLDTALGVLQDAEQLIPPAGSADHDLSLGKILNERGNIYRLKGDAGKAIDAFKQASTLDPDNSLILYNLGDMYSAIGDHAQAISTLQQAVIIDPRDAYNRAYYAKLLAESGDLTQARSEAAQATRLAPTNAYAAGEYGVVSYLAKDPATARAQLSQAVQLDPLRFPEFYYYLGRLDLDSGALQSARDNLTKAVALGSNTAEYAYYLGLSYERGAGLIAADRAKALENYQKALKLAPNYQAAKDAINRVK